MSEHSETTQLFFVIFSSLLILVLFLSKVLHNAPRLNSILSEPAMILLVGMFFSFLVSLFFVFKEEGNSRNYNNYSVEYEVEQDLANSLLSFQNKVFFLALLPPILFNSGYQLQRELFYRHFAPISLFACVGTCISGLGAGSILVGLRNLGLFGGFNPSVMELLTFGAMIAATDTVSVVGVLQAKKVDPHLFSLVFGESALNDAVAIVLFRTLGTFLVMDAFGDESSWGIATLKFIAHLTVQASCSPLLGMFYAFCIALALKAIDLRGHEMLELSLYVMAMYVPYMLADALELSGMISIFFTGIFARRYMAPNVAESTREHAEMLFKLFAFLAETCIFLELGLSVFGLSGKYQWKFIGWALLAALVGRAASIYPLAAIYNLSLTKWVKINCNSVACTDDSSFSTNESKSPSESSPGPSAVGKFLNHQNSTSSTMTSSWTRETPERRKDKRISLNFMHMLTFAGLRGAVAYACARDFPNLNGNRDSFVTTTMAIVLFTIVVMGGATEPLMEKLQIPTNVDEDEYMKQWHAKRKLKGRFHRFEYHFMFRTVVPRPKVSSPMTDESSERQMINRSMTPRIGNSAACCGVDGDAFDYVLNDESSNRSNSLARYHYLQAYARQSSGPIRQQFYPHPTPAIVESPSANSAPPVQYSAYPTTNDPSMNDDSNIFNFNQDESFRHREHTISYGPVLALPSGSFTIQGNGEHDSSRNSEQAPPQMANHQEMRDNV